MSGGTASSRGMASAAKTWSVFETRSGAGVLCVVLAGLVAISVMAQRSRDARFATDRPAEQVLYVQSPEMMKRLALSYDDVAADVYWIRALQHFGRSRLTTQGRPPVDVPLELAKSPFALAFPLLTEAAPFGAVEMPSTRFALLYPLLNITTTLDPLFKMAYRFGAIFLSEAPPGGPGRPDLAIALLEKGIKASPTRWQYYQDAGFVHYWARRDYVSAAKWFERASEIKGAPYWLKQLAASTLAMGGSREASRTLYLALAQSSDNDFVRTDAQRRLAQLDTLDFRDRLREAVDRYRAAGGREPFTWDNLMRAGLLRGVPTDPTGMPMVIDPVSGAVDVDPRSPLQPLPDEPPTAAPRPPA